jgi:hypothetical protein
VSEEQLRARLESLGAGPIGQLRLTDNRSVMVSFTRRGVLSVHRGYASAPDRVLKAIVQFVARGTPRSARAAARHLILSYKVVLPEKGPVRRRDRTLPGDREAIDRLATAFRLLNERHFGAALTTLPIRLSGRMRSRLGHLALDRDGAPTEITISRGHVAQHDWSAVEETLLHEMVHLWQHASGHPVDHGPAFRAKARAVGAHAAAQRSL